MPQDEKLWLQRDVQKVAEAAAKAAIQSTGRALPCRVTALNPTDPATGAALGYSWVTVQFEANLPYTQADGTTAYYQLPPLTLPKAESQWLRAPTQVGDFGITQPADTYLGAVTGLGSGVADTGMDYGNLSTLVWLPVGSATFAAAPDPQKAWINGPAGAVVSDTALTAVITAAANLITIAAPSGTVQFQGAGTTSGDAIVRQSDLQTALNAMVTNIHTWATTAFSSSSAGSGWTGTTPTAPTASGSSKTFTG